MVIAPSGASVRPTPRCPGRRPVLLDRVAPYGPHSLPGFILLVGDPQECGVAVVSEWQRVSHGCSAQIVREGPSADEVWL